jgi:hypothetical protein
MMITEMDIETSVYYVHLTRLIAREDYICFCVVRSDWGFDKLEQFILALTYVAEIETQIFMLQHITTGT